MGHILLVSCGIFGALLILGWSIAYLHWLRLQAHVRRMLRTSYSTLVPLLEDGTYSAQEAATVRAWYADMLADAEHWWPWSTRRQDRWPQGYRPCCGSPWPEEHGEWTC